MNVLFLSPAFPPNAYRYCVALKARGVTVLGIGDAPESELGAEARAALDAYVFVPGMADYAELRAAVAGLIERHGAIDRLDSNGEHWLDAEGRLRDDFDVPGLGSRDVRRFRSKLGMAERFAAAGIETPISIRNDDPDAVRRFADLHGFPLVFKPELGSGAADTFSVDDREALERALAVARPDLLVQKFVRGEIVTFDGLVDRDGAIVFAMSHVYDRGIMEVRQGQLDGHYYSLRAVPTAVDAQGRRAIAAFGLRERFFHVEFFVRDDGTLVALELNLRPPGGYTTEMMGHACGLDVYALWAAVLVGAPCDHSGVRPHRYVAHAGRRATRTYAESEAQLVAGLGPTLVEVLPVPPAFAVTMGDVAYLLAHAELDALLAAIARVHAQA